MTALMVGCTIVLLLVVDYLRTRWRPSEESVGGQVSVPKLENDFTVPAGLFVGPGHTWASVEPDGSVRVGLDRFASRLLGRPDQLQLAAEGTKLERDDAALVLWQSGKSVAFPSPLEGVVTAVNTELLRHPENLAREPYEDGWLLRLRPAHLAQEVRRLRLGAEAQGWMRGEVARFKDFLSLQMRWDTSCATAPDGGLPVSHVMEHLNGRAWEHFEEEFLASH